jgi:superfamily I DNA and/or RNA helicase
MHPEISRVSNSIIYGGQLVDSLSRDTLKEIGTFLEASPFATTPLVLYDVSSTNPWSSRLEQGGRYNLYSAVLSAELARRAAGAGIESIGIISPYSVHARLIKMMLDDSGDAKLRHLKVSTVHRFQGLEQEVIIFDIAEGPMPRYGPSGLVDGVELASQAAKLINVSITRPKAQIAIVANVDYLASRLRPDSILMRVLEEVRQRGTIVDSQEVLNDYFCDEFERWARLPLRPLASVRANGENELCAIEL